MRKILRPDSAVSTNNSLLRKSLSRYFAITQNEKPAKFKISRSLPAQFTKSSTMDELWNEHARLTNEFRSIERKMVNNAIFDSMKPPEESFFDLKIEIASRILENCRLCNRKCNVNRASGERGFCGCGITMQVSSIFGHMGEEPELVPSGTIFTLGCTLRCLHCQNWTISQWLEEGEDYSPKTLAEEVDRLRLSGCRNVNLVGGEPTPWLGNWLQAFKYVNENVPVVWNSNSYYSPETASLLAGFADVYLLDFKYGPNDCARRISGAKDYWAICKANHIEAKKYGELIVRVLVLPGHLDCCTKPVLQWISENIGANTRVNLMFQYRPEWRAREISELRRRLTANEMAKVVELAEASGLRNFIT